MTDPNKLKFLNSLTNLDKAMENLEDAIRLPIAEKRDLAGVLLSFINVFELTWKTLKRHLENEGIMVSTPRQALEQGFKIGMIQNSEIWVQMMEDRNSSVHTYDEAFAQAFYQRVVDQYISLLRQTHQNLKLA